MFPTTLRVTSILKYVAPGSSKHRYPSNTLQYVACKGISILISSCWVYELCNLIPILVWKPSFQASAFLGISYTSSSRFIILCCPWLPVVGYFLFSFASQQDSLSVSALLTGPLTVTVWWLNQYGALVKWKLTQYNSTVRKWSLSVTICPPQISLELSSDWTRSPPNRLIDTRIQFSIGNTFVTDLSSFFSLVLTKLH